MPAKQQRGMCGSTSNCLRHVGVIWFQRASHGTRYGYAREVLVLWLHLPARAPEEVPTTAPTLLLEKLFSTASRKPQCAPKHNPPDDKTTSKVLAAAVRETRVLVVQPRFGGTTRSASPGPPPRPRQGICVEKAAQLCAAAVAAMTVSHAEIIMLAASPQCQSKALMPHIALEIYQLLQQRCFPCEFVCTSHAPSPIPHLARMPVVVVVFTLCLCLANQNPAAYLKRLRRSRPRHLDGTDWWYLGTALL